MFKTKSTLVAGALAFGVASLAMTFGASAATKGQFDNMCTEGLAMHKQVKTDCSVNETIDGKVYCFGNEKAKAEFDKNPKANLTKAEAYYSKIEKK
jgi:YHS domain-containing protein